MSSEYSRHLQDVLSPLGEVSIRRLFGCDAFYLNGRIFGIVFDEVLHLKVGEANRADYEAAGSEPFRYQAKGKTVALPYWCVPLDVLDDEEQLCHWAEKSYRVALASPAPKKKKSMR